MSNRKLPAIVIVLLVSVVGYLTRIGVAQKVAFVLVFSMFDFLLLAFIKRRATKEFGDIRAIRLFVYGFGFVALVIFVLILLGFN